MLNTHYREFHINKKVSGRTRKQSTVAPQRAGKTRKKPSHFPEDGSREKHLHDFQVYLDLKNYLPAPPRTAEEQKRFQIDEYDFLDIAENIQDVLFKMDSNFRFTYISPTIKKLSGYSPEDFLGGSIIANLSPKYQRIYRSLQIKILHAISTKENFSHHTTELEWIQRDGQKIWVEASFSPINNTKGTIDGLAGTLRDVTRLVVARKELEQAKEVALQENQAKSDFLASMSHEIRTPLNGVMGMLQVLKSTVLDRKQQEYTKHALRAGANLLNLINDILDLSKIEVGKLESKRNDINLRSCINTVISNCKTLLNTSEVSLHYHIANDIPEFVRIDDKSLRQILFNLIGNAIKFTEHGEITITVSPQTLSSQSVHLKFTISDTGIGISPSLIDHLFEPFKQANNSFHPQYSGSGLGLHIVRQLVDLMEGTIDIQSREKHGTTVTFTVPAQTVKNIPKTQDTPPPIQTTFNTTPMRILVVDDDEISAQVAAAMLQNQGHSVSLASNGARAIQRIEKERYDCIFMDIQMPEMDGLETSKAIRDKKNQWSDTPIIALTAHAMKGDRELFINAGMNDYLTKPISPANLKDTLSKITRSQSKAEKPV